MLMSKKERAMAKKSHSNETLIWGLILVSLGIIFLLQKLLNIEIFAQIWQFWPLALIIWGVVLIVRYAKK
jgi:hypothetical protein